ncbi:MAG: hypothetical protein NC548_11765 [Lachnospiraceae bacterium]|nr:hypothetical protein [Lachnospiraceae bacterium]
MKRMKGTAIHIYIVLPKWEDKNSGTIENLTFLCYTIQAEIKSEYADL